jgi:hypothetical protein
MLNGLVRIETKHSINGNLSPELSWVHLAAVFLFFRGHSKIAS